MDNIAIQIDHEELIEFTKIYFKLKRPFFLWGTIGIGKCLEENTPVLTDKGEIPIKELKAGDKVIGFDFNTQKIQKAEVLNCFKKTGKFIEIGIGENTIKSSAEHHFYTANGWKQAKNLKIGDTIYLYGEKQYPLSNRDNRRRRQFIHTDRQTEKQENSADTDISNIQRFCGTDDLVRAELSAEKQKFHKGQERTPQNSISGSYLWNTETISFTERNTANFHNQEETDRTTAKIYGIEKPKMEKSQTARQGIHKGRNRDFLGIEESEFIPISITKINRENEAEAILRDITTSTGNYIAGGILVHNSETIHYAGQQLADELNLKFETDIRQMDTEETFGFADIRISQLDQTDMRGIPVPTEVNGKRVTIWILPNFLPRNENSKGILFFDELNLSPPSVQSACYQLINDRRLGDYVLPKGWFIVACGNRISDRTNVFDMSSALSNRFCHLELRPPTMDIWAKWALRHDLDSRIITFNYWKEGTYLFKFDSSAKSKAFATPRSWYFAHTLIKNIHPTNEAELSKMTKLMASAVGEGIAIEFEAYEKLNRKIDLDQILRNPQTIEDIEEVDLLYSVISGISERYKKDNKIFDNVLMVAKYLKSEFAVLMLHFVRNASPSNWDKQTTTLKNPVWNELASKYKNYLMR